MCRHEDSCVLLFSTIIELKRGSIMKFLLTSAGITNDSIRKALVNLLGKPKVDVSLYAFDD